MTDETNADTAALNLRIRDLERQAEFRVAHIDRLERANADLHSRLDELRRVFGPLVPRVAGVVADSVQAQLEEAMRRRATNETASDLLDEHMSRIEREIADGGRPNRGRFTLSDPAGGG